MVIFSLGLPGRFADWCDALVARLVENAFGAVLVTPIDTLDDLALVAMRADAQVLVACSRHPAVRLQTEIIQAGKPFLIALDDPRAALRELIATTDLQLPDAVRPVASSCATMLALSEAPTALIVSSNQRRSRLDIARRIARHLQLPVSEAKIAEVVAGMATIPTGSERDLGTVGVGEEANATQELIDGALTPYIKRFAGGELDPLVWAPGILIALRKEGNRPATGPIDVTGPAQCLVCGPYINLPPGVWTADVVLGFSAETSGLNFKVDVWAGIQVADVRIVPTQEQVIDVNLAFTIGDSAVEPVEIRIFTERAAFDGRIALGAVTLTRSEGVGDEVRAKLAAVLQR